MARCFGGVWSGRPQPQALANPSRFRILGPLAADDANAAKHGAQPSLCRTLGRLAIDLGVAGAQLRDQVVQRAVASFPPPPLRHSAGSSSRALLEPGLPTFPADLPPAVGAMGGGRMRSRTASRGSPCSAVGGSGAGGKSWKRGSVRANEPRCASPACGRTCGSDA